MAAWEYIRGWRFQPITLSEGSNMIRFNGRTGEWEIDSADGWQTIDRLGALRYMEQDAEGRIGEFTIMQDWVE